MQAWRSEGSSGLETEILLHFNMLSMKHEWELKGGSDVVLIFQDLAF